MPETRRLIGVAAALVAWTLATGETRAQEYASGQNIAPAYEGWEQNDDGSFNLVFGYMNRNWEEVIDLPIGHDNSFEPGPADRGQPTRFLPRRNRFIFKIRVSPDFGDKEVVWTLTSHGQTERAYATLKPDYFIDNFVIQANNGAGGAAGTGPGMADNTAPALTLEVASTLTARVGHPITLTAVATDDGKPRPRALRAVNPRVPGAITTDGANGLRLSWFVYRGTGHVTFDPPQTRVWEDTRDGRDSPWSPGWKTPEAPPDNRWVTRATFDEPGTYVVRCLAHDGGLMTHTDVTIDVSQ